MQRGALPGAANAARAAADMQARTGGRAKWVRAQEGLVCQLCISWLCLTAPGCICLVPCSGTPLNNPLDAPAHPAACTCLLQLFPAALFCAAEKHCRKAATAAHAN